jgi:hypothetical protein
MLQTTQRWLGVSSSKMLSQILDDCLKDVCIIYLIMPRKQRLAEKVGYIAASYYMTGKAWTK